MLAWPAVPIKLFRVAVIVLAGAAAGLAGNAVHPAGLELGRNAFLRQGDEMIPVVEAKARHERGALFLDARGRMFWEMARVPGSVNLPEEDFDRAFAALEPQLRARFDLVIYCSGYGCETSHKVAERLRDKGIHAAIVDEGFPAWQDAGYPVEQGPGQP